ncbi:putative bifunctional diguanylate cyclase/phosphodiesterase [Marinobacter zhanjiangensis]|uniref:Phosphodiesterase n=1 Tax=Marinobacter zhanjiangensis TaxID=578215 RepID=A0ABQ3AL92_9GAMM|nr:EAL domain-containing protein [Marinobacter zhanjiangensis]GGY60857.1 phosphodiesterase [Marinobacter zhanjiangensis]
MSLDGLGFRGRLLVAMLSLVAATALALGLSFMVYLLEDEEQRAADSLDVAARVTTEIIAGRSELLTGNLQVLVDDFGFRSAIASDNQATMASALDNHAGRAGADIAIVLDSEGTALASIGTQEADIQRFLPELLARANDQGQADQILSTGNRALQMFVVPVRGAGLRAWLVAGFALDDDFARRLAGLTGTEVVFRDRTGASVLASSRPPDSMGQLPPPGNNGQMEETNSFFSRTLQLGSAQPSPVQAVLLIDREQALANYYDRAADLALILLVAVVLSGMVVLLTARALGRPVLDLARFATAIGDGRNAPEPPPPRTRELRTLQNALTTMQKRVGEREERIRFNAFHDELTGLANRKALNETLENALANQQPLLLAGITLTRFRALNDTLGFEFGDQVLVLAAERLRACLPDKTRLLTRSGGNEFVVLTDPDQGPLATLLTRLRDQLQASTTIGETPINLHVAVAGLELPRDATTPDEIRRRLRLTLKRAEDSPQQVAAYESGGDESHLRELTLTQDLRHAIANDGLNLVYQPKIAMDSARMVQVEALARWHHPELGFVSPEEFILLAEQTGQIRNLTRFILTRIARDLAVMHQEGLMIGAAINLSALDLSNTRLPDDIRQAFGGQGIDVHWLTFEVTESAIMTDTESARHTLDQLRAMGASLSVDDFGTGYSSLSQLRQLPVQELKIDKSFVLRLNQEPQDQLIVRSTIDMAHGLGLTVVAEGIENLDSWRLLQGWGCDKGQGFYMARPMPPADLPGWAGDFREQAATLRPMTGDIS